MAQPEQFAFIPNSEVSADIFESDTAFGFGAFGTKMNAKIILHPRFRPLANVEQEHGGESLLSLYRRRKIPALIPVSIEKQMPEKNIDLHGSAPDKHKFACS